MHQGHAALRRGTHGYEGTVLQNWVPVGAAGCVALPYNTARHMITMRRPPGSTASVLEVPVQLQGQLHNAGA